jgi:hypothetical protein
MRLPMNPAAAARSLAVDCPQPVIAAKIGFAPQDCRSHLSGDLITAHARHADVHEHEVRYERPRRPDGRQGAWLVFWLRGSRMKTHRVEQIDNVLAGMAQCVGRLWVGDLINIVLDFTHPT